MSSQSQQLAKLIREADSVVALTGAGISVPSGIPDFRSPMTGIWAGINPMEIAHVDVWRAEPAKFWSFYGQRFATLGEIRPNLAHEALVALERKGSLSSVLTQNIDLLHTKAGSVDVVELHGSIAGCHCPACGGTVDLSDTLKLIASSEDGVPPCPDCGRPLKPDVVLFGDMLPAEAISRAEDLAQQADLMICIGSSLEVYPVAGLPELTLRSGGKLALITQGSTPYDGAAAVKLGGDVVDELQAVLAYLGD